MIYFTADQHFGHNNILQFQRDTRHGSNLQEHAEWLIDCWNSIVTKRDTVYVLGDFAWNVDGCKYAARLNGNKLLLLGNHDRNHTKMFQEYFTIVGFRKFKGLWLSHCPIHPAELRGHPNVHGHVHSQNVQDPWYLNVGVDNWGGCPQALDDIKAIFNLRGVLK